LLGVRCWACVVGRELLGCWVCVVGCALLWGRCCGGVVVGVLWGRCCGVVAVAAGVGALLCVSEQNL
jgi:hypothetical protein